jgi:Zn-dependent peptidase ImmA (M78 family)
MLENGHQEFDDGILTALAEALDCAPNYLNTEEPAAAFDRPKLRAYADAPQRAVDRTLYDTITAVEAIRSLGLRALEMRVPTFDGDLNDDDAIDRVAADVRSSAGLDGTEVISNVIRSVERLGCVVLPLDGELGRHWGMSLAVDEIPVIRVTRPSNDPEFNIPGDRQRFTVAHELGHLILHSGSGQPSTPADAARLEREANRFAAAFLVPGDAALEDLEAAGGRVTLSVLSQLKQKWGYSIKAFVFRFRELGVIDDTQARSLYKQISARRWNKDEPHRPGTEAAVWFRKALQERFPGKDGLKRAAAIAGLHQQYLHRWLDWSPSGVAPETAPVTALAPRPGSISGQGEASGRVTRLPRRR